MQPCTAPKTTFSDLGGAADLGSSGLRFADLGLATSVFDARASGSLELPLARPRLG